MNRFLAKIKEKEQLIVWRLEKGSLWLNVNGEVHCHTIEKSGRRGRKRKNLQTAVNEIGAPMPGKITKVLLSEGDSVAVGQPVVVLEAMKMEYTLSAQSSGVIEKIYVDTGDQTTLGQKLVLIKPVGENSGS